MSSFSESALHPLKVPNKNNKHSPKRTLFLNFNSIPPDNNLNYFKILNAISL